MYAVQREGGDGPIRKLHRNLLLPIGHIPVEEIPAVEVELVEESDDTESESESESEVEELLVRYSDGSGSESEPQFEPDLFVAPVPPAPVPLTPVPLSPVGLPPPPPRPEPRRLPPAVAPPVVAPPVAAPRRSIRAKTQPKWFADYHVQQHRAHPSSVSDAARQQVLTSLVNLTTVLLNTSESV